MRSSPASRTTCSTSAPTYPRLATGPPTTAKTLRIAAAQVARLEREIDAVSADLGPLRSFVLRGGTNAAAHLHLACTVARRAERAAWAVAAAEPVNPDALTFLNRLSDLLFVLAREANAGGTADVLWQPGLNRD